MSVYIQIAIANQDGSSDFQFNANTVERIANKLKATNKDKDLFLIEDGNPNRTFIENVASAAKGSCQIVNCISRNRDGAYGVVSKRDSNQSTQKKLIRHPITKWVRIIDSINLFMLLELIDIAKINPTLVYDIRNDAVLDIEDVASIRQLLEPANRPYVSPDSAIPEEIRNQLIEAYVQSEEVASCLLKNPLTKRQAIMLILGADKSLLDKASTIQRLTNLDNPLHELLDEAIKAPAGFPAKTSWGRIERWSFAEWSRKLECLLAEGKGECVYVKGHGDLLDGTAYFDVPLPYLPGDVVSLDCEPFGQNGVGLVLSDDNGSASAPIVYQSHHDFYALSRINIGQRWGDHHDALSPIYRMHKKAQLPAEEQPLTRMSDLIGGDKMIARQLWSAIIRSRGGSEIPGSFFKDMRKATINPTGDLVITFYGKTNPDINYIAAFRINGSAWMRLTPASDRSKNPADPKSAGRWSLSWNGSIRSDTKTVAEYDKRIYAGTSNKTPTYAVILPGNGTDQLSSKMICIGSGWTVPSQPSATTQIDFGCIDPEACIYDVSTGERIAEQHGFNVEIRCDEAPELASLLWFNSHLTFDVHLYAYEGDISSLITNPKPWGAGSSKTFIALESETGFRDLALHGSKQTPTLLAHNGQFAFADNVLDMKGQSTIKLQPSAKPFLKDGSIEVPWLQE